MTVGITGSSGFIGSRLALRLTREPDTRVVRLDQKMFQDPGALARAVSDCDVIVHLAGGRFGKGDDFDYEANVAIADTLIQALTAAHAKPALLYIQTKAGASGYGKGKRAAEARLRAYAAGAKIPFGVLTLPSIFGEGAQPNHHTVVATIAQNLAHGIPTEVNPEGTVELLYVEDAIGAMFDFIRAPKDSSQAFGGTPMSVPELHARLKAWNDDRENSRSPSLASDLDRKLYRTLLSYRPVSVLAIYRGKVGENRGTPLRVRAILERLAHDPRFSLTVASWDETLPFPAQHVHLDNSKKHDLAQLRSAARHADVVLGHTMGTWYYLLFLKLFCRKPIVLEMHGFLEEEARLYGTISLPGYYLSKIVHAPLYYLCSGITTCGGLGTDILSRYNPHVMAMIGGIDASLFHPGVPASLHVMRKAGDVVIGYAGNTRKWQGMPFLARAFEELRKKDSRYQLAILSSEKKGLPEGEGIQIIPAVPHDEVPGFLAACDILVIPRENDRVSRLGPPSKLLEYMAMEKTVVVSQVGYMDVIVKDGENGRTFPPSDVGAFIRVIEEVADESTRSRLATDAARTVEVQYTWEKELPKLTDLLRAAAGRTLGYTASHP